jgi:hypothetical protein
MGRLQGKTAIVRGGIPAPVIALFAGAVERT